MLDTPLGHVFFLNHLMREFCPESLMFYEVKSRLAHIIPDHRSYLVYAVSYTRMVDLLELVS